MTLSPGFTMNSPAVTPQVRPQVGQQPSATEQFTGERRAQAENYFRQQGLMGPEDATRSQQERDTEFNQAFARYSQNNALGSGQAGQFLMALLMMLFGLSEDWQSPDAAGLPGGGRFSNMGERSRAQASAAVHGTVRPVEVEPGTRSAGSLVVELAQQELGVRERGGGNRGEDMARFGAAAGIGEGLPWCASFVSYIYARAGIDARSSGDGVGGTAMALNFETQFQRAKAYHSFRSSGSRAPQPGDVVVFDRGAPGSGQGHVGIVERVENGQVTLIEGNSGDAVRRNTYSLEALRRGEHGARGFGSVDEATRNNQRFARRGEERVASRDPEVTAPLPVRVESHAPVQGGSLRRD
jgi:uncharacterized protein (TIGR02594 family)